MFDIIMATLFTIAIVASMMIAFKPVWDTMKRDELEREQKRKNDHSAHSA